MDRITMVLNRSMMATIKHVFTLAPLALCLVCAAGVASAGSSAAAGAGSTIRLTALPSTAQVNLTDIVRGSNSVSIACARNETESFQVVVSPAGAALREVDATVSVLRNASGAALPANCVDVFCNVFVPIRMTDPRSSMAPGMWADALVPRTNPYTGKPVQGPAWGARGFTGERFRGRRFDVWKGQQQPIWVDVRVPKDAAPGIYRGEIEVVAANAPAARMPVSVEVWDFALPDGPSLENHFGGFDRIAGYYALKADSEKYLLLEDRFIEMMAAHRINPPLPGRLRPTIGPDGSALFDDDLDRRLSAYVARHAMTNIEVPRAPFDVFGKDRSKAAAYYRSWYEYLKRKGWAERAYLYMHDETLNAKSYAQARRMGEFVGEAEPRLRRLVVTQTYPRNPEWGTLDGALDIWCPLFGYIDEPSIRRVQQAGDDVWTYTALVQSVPRFHPDYENVKEPDVPHWAASDDGRPPYWQMDFPILGYRIAPWLARRYGITGLLYWSVCFWAHRNPWDNPTYGDHWNGEGMLFYPGSEAGIEGPVASARLKNLRDGMEDYEYFVLLERRGERAAVDEIVRRAVPTWGSWEKNADRIRDLRRSLAREIIRRGS